MQASSMKLPALRGSEGRLFESAAAMIVDLLSEEDRAFGCAAFDQLPYLERLELFEEVLRATLLDDGQACERSEQTDAAIRLVFAWIDAMTCDELTGNTPARRKPARSSNRRPKSELPSWMELVEQALRETGKLRLGWNKDLASCRASINELAARVVQGGWAADPTLRENSPIWRRDAHNVVGARQSRRAKVTLDVDAIRRRNAIVRRLKELTAIDRVQR
jgi:hypothetical protein